MSRSSLPPPDPDDQLPPSDRLPEATVARLPVYLRALTGLADAARSPCPATSWRRRPASTRPSCARTSRTSARTASAASATTSSYLVYQISRELGLTQDWPVVIVGVGNLGHALANYGGFATRGFRIAALFDADPAVVGQRDRRPGRAATSTSWRRSSPARGRDRRDRHAGRRRPGGVRPAGRRRGDQHPELRPVVLSCRTASTCARSTCRSSCRSWRSTSSGARPSRVRTPPAATAATGTPPQRRCRPMSCSWSASRSHRPRRSRCWSGPRSTRRHAAQAAPRRSHCAEHVGRGVVLSTCNRVEVYAEVDRFHGGVADGLRAARPAPGIPSRS